MKRGIIPLLLLLGLGMPVSGAAPVTKSVRVNVDEGTSMAVAVSPNGRLLAMDLQGSIWILPAQGGAARRITDVFSDARQPVWSPDGKTIVFFAYRDGGYHLWSVAPDGSDLRQLTRGAFDDREPVFSHDGNRIAFSSDRGNPLGSDYNIFTLDMRSGEIRQLTRDPADDVMPSWSPDDSQVSYASSRNGGRGVWVVSAVGGAERRLITATVRIDAASWMPDGDILAHAVNGARGWLEHAGKPITGDEHVFPFRPSFLSRTEFFYTADGKIRKRDLNGAVQTVAFTADLEVTPAAGAYPRKKRDFDSQAPRKAMGIVRPVLSPDGKSIAFAALGDIYVMPLGGEPRNLTQDAAYDADPAWSPDGSQLVYASDKAGGLLQLWLRDMKTGQERQLTRLATQPISPAFSPDGKRIAFLDADGMWRRASVAVVDVTTAEVRPVHASLFAPGAPSWSPDGTRIAVAMVAPYSAKYREGTNQILTMSATGTASDDRWFAPVPHLSIDSRGWNGPVWSPDGGRMAAIYEGVLTTFPVSSAGEPLGPPRRLTSEIAYAPSWSGDGRYILYQSNDRLRLLDSQTGKITTVPLNLTYKVQVPKTRLIVHVGKLVDGVSRTARSDMDIVIEGNRIRAVEKHKPGRGALEMPHLTAMPGLIDFHTHRQSDSGEQQGRGFLAYGITTIRSPGGLPYEAVEDREATDAGIRVSPRIFNTGHLMEWQRVYYKMGVAISSDAHLAMELERSRILGFDMLKSYVRMPDAQQRHIVDFAHSIGVPASSHEIYPAAFAGMDSMEHTDGTSRRGYSPKVSLGRSYGDVSRILGAARMTMTPTMGWSLRDLLDKEPQLRSDPRLELNPPWLKRQITAMPTGPTPDMSGIAKLVMDAHKSGARIVAGTDQPEGMYLHAELGSYVRFGMTPYNALRAATAVPAQFLGLDAGVIAPGKLADIVLVEGDPLEDIASAHRVKHVVANGRLFGIQDLLSGRAKQALPQER